MTPSGTIGPASLVIVDLTVNLGPKAPTGCHLVTDLVPSGLVPVGNLQGWVDPTRMKARRRASPTRTRRSASGSRFCAEKTPKSHVVHLRYFARVVTSGTYAWEPTDRRVAGQAGRAALTKASVVTIR